MHTYQRASLRLALVLALVACGSSDQAASEGTSTPRDPASRSAQPAATKNYADTTRKSACEIMPPSLVSSLFDIPESKLGDLRPGKSSCRYHLDRDDQAFYAQLQSMRWFKDAGAAQKWFANATADETREEVDAEVAEVHEKAEERGTLDTEAELAVAKEVTGAFAAQTPDGGVVHEQIDGIGDEARFSNRDGTLWVRSGNIMFSIAAYKGPKKPWGGETKMDAIMAAERAWIAETLPDRRRDALKLAEPVVAALEKLAD